ncbi:MAG TPA: class I SAM-dependent methyltransferase [Geobacteraceae bacterium]
MQTHEKRDFDSKAATWDEEPRRVMLAREVTAAIIRELPLEHGMNVLDYGCGSGLVTLGLQPHVGRITGADSSQGMLDVLAGKVREQGLGNVATRLIDLTSQESLEGGFDVIVSSMTLHHVCDVPALISRFLRSLKPGGWLALADLEAEDGSFHDDPTGVCHHGFERRYLQEVLSGHGCVDVRVMEAASVRKSRPEGDERLYPVLLAVGRKGA